ncbi:MAG: glycoside hydrolase family 88 protein [Planctomycetes bacterium]|nr:glycoside hydrolase family 88 protein [Planctomycetota bacterium]
MTTENSIDVLVIAPTAQPTPNLVCFARLLLEKGAVLSRDARGYLPRTFPRNAAGMRAVAVGPTHAHKYRAKLQALKRGGALVLVYDFLEQDEPVPEASMRNSVERLCLNARLKPRYAEALKAGRLIPDAWLLRRLADNLAKAMPLLHEWKDYGCYSYWQPARAAAEYLGDRKLAKLLETSITYHLENVPNNVDSTDSLAMLRHVLHRHERTEDVALLDYARSRVDSCLTVNADPAGYIIQRASYGDRWVWGETLSMSMPATACLARITGNRQYLDRVMRQVRQTHAYCKSPLGPWFHAGRPDGHTPVIWGRGVGWVLLGLSGILEELGPDDREQRIYLVGLLKEILTGLLKTQDRAGFWRNVIDNDESRPEATATCMIAQVYARALRLGWIRSQRAESMVRKAWNAIKTFFVLEDHMVGGCGGTAASLSRNYYLSRPHGQSSSGMVLQTGVEVMRALGDTPEWH